MQDFDNLFLVVGTFLDFISKSGRLARPPSSEKILFSNLLLLNKFVYLLLVGINGLLESSEAFLTP